MTSVKDWIKQNEGLRLKPYRDTQGKFTLGYGRNIDDNGITTEEAEFLFNNDYYKCRWELADHDWYFDQPEHVKWALINMCFNMGITRLLGFTKMIAALKEKNYTKAALEALDSKWAKQVGDRAKQVALMMREGF